MPGHRGTAATNIDSVPAHRNIYIGTDAEVGYLKFFTQSATKTPGYDIYNNITQSYASMGPAATLALGITECCARFGRGKVYFYARAFHGKNQETKDTYPDEYISFPDLFFTDHVWTSEQVIQWFKTPHWQRLDLLSARGNALSTALPVVPITLCWESNDSSNIMFYRGMSPVMLYWNSPGAVYLGLHNDISQHAVYSTRYGNLRSVWNAEKANITQFQMRSDLDLVKRLLAFYESGTPGIVCLYGNIVEQSIKAHRRWVANGGYTITSDKDLGASIAAAANKIRALRAGYEDTTMEHEIFETEANREFRELRAEAQAWPESDKQALAEYTIAANAGVSEVSVFLTSNKNWQDLSAERKTQIFEIWTLEQESSWLTDNVDRPIACAPTDDTAEPLSSPEPPAEPPRPTRMRGARATRARAIPDGLDDSDDQEDEL